MREYKFRGISIETKQWVYGHLAYADNNGAVIATKAGGVQVWRESVGQYTDIKDKNGKEIFEGDITRKWNHDGTKVVDTLPVEWAQEQSSFVRGNEHNWNLGIYAGLYGKNSLEVIGNIHDNPELLEPRS